MPSFQFTAPQQNRRSKTSRSKPAFSGLTRIDIYMSVLQARHSFCHRHRQDTDTGRTQTPAGHRDQLHNVLSQYNTNIQRSLLKTETVMANTTALGQTGAPSDPGVQCDHTEGTQEKPASGSTLLGSGSTTGDINPGKLECSISISSNHVRDEKSNMH